MTIALANSGIPLGQFSGSDAINALHQSITAFNEATSKQTVTLIRLTWTMTVLTVVMTVSVVVQIYLGFRTLP